MNVEIDCTVLYHVDPKDANDVWRKIGGGDEAAHLIVRPYTHNIMRMVVSKYSSEQMAKTLSPSLMTKPMVFRKSGASALVIGYSVCVPRARGRRPR